MMQQEQTTWVQVLKCGNCAAPVTVEQTRCEYCGSSLKPVLRDNFDREVPPQAITGSVITGSVAIMVEHSGLLGYTMAKRLYLMAG